MQSNNLGSSAQGTNAQFGQGQQRAGGEKKDWLDKGISAAGDKLGMHISDRNADRAGDYANNEFRKKQGHGLPGVR
ncbi:hypothetical protein C8Q76DRAFT_797917 [Earliella scabrosa]|nr:hypothetical protein C8Q76DRAFT_797917 [Earliella scabrosa]